MLHAQPTPNLQLIAQIVHAMMASLNKAITVSLNVVLTKFQTIPSVDVNVYSVSINQLMSVLPDAVKLNNTMVNNVFVNQDMVSGIKFVHNAQQMQLQTQQEQAVSVLLKVISSIQ